MYQRTKREPDILSDRKDKTIIGAPRLTRLYTVGDSSVVGIRDDDLDISAVELVVLKGESCGT